MDRPRKWAYMLVFHAEVSIELGRHDRCEADVREILRVASDLPHAEMLHGYSHWLLAVSASHRRDAAETLKQVRLTEVHKGVWWTRAGAEFLAEAADCLDRVGHSVLAMDYLRRAQADPQDAEPVIAMAEAALAARHGDSRLAEERLLAAPATRLLRGSTGGSRCCGPTRRSAAATPPRVRSRRAPSRRRPGWAWPTCPTPRKARSPRSCSAWPWRPASPPPWHWRRRPCRCTSGCSAASR